MTDHHNPDIIRVSDAERLAVTERLATAFAEGRLDTAEYEQRMGLAMAAKTMGDLVPLTIDLPVPDQQLKAKQVERKRKEWREYGREWRAWLGGSVILNAIWGTTSLVDGELQDYFPAIPMGIWAAVLLVLPLFPSDGDKKHKNKQHDK